ncbi:MAG: galactitol-1-phosphate 5-dehydrogenase [Candidatus Omnitrophota bacterium]
MKALVLHAPGDLRFEPDRAQPDPKDGWTLVKVAASGICGSDLPRIMQTGAYCHPLIPGHEFAGTVENVAERGRKVAVLPIIPCGKCPGCRLGPFHCEKYDFLGSRRDGGFAEYCLVPNQNLFPLPENFSLEEGAFLEPLLVALYTARRAGLKGKERVLVFGAGTIGLLISQWARILGAGEIWVADIREESLRIAQNCGFENVINPASDLFQRLDNFDLVFEAAGSGKALISAVGKSAPKGTITVVGRDTKDTVLPLTIFEKIMRKEVDLRGCWGYDIRGEEKLIYSHLQSGSFNFQPMITQRIPIEEGPEIIEKMWRKEMFYCKVLIKIT